MRATKEQKQEMLDLIAELRVIILRIPNIKIEVVKQRTQERLNEIKAKIQDFRKRYPDD